jgi:transposase
MERPVSPYDRGLIAITASAATRAADGGRAMKKDTRIHVGLDVHKDTIAVCWLRDGSATEETRQIPNEPRAIRKLFRQLQEEGQLQACYEAGPCGDTVRRQLEAMGIACDVVAPSLIPRRPGERIKTDRRDARKLARLSRAGELTPIRIPTEAEEAVRDLLRCREDLAEDVTRQRHRLGKFLLRHGRIWREGRAWTLRHWAWLRAQRFEDPVAQRTFEEYLAQLDFGIDRLRALDGELVAVAQQAPWQPLVARLCCLRGIDLLSALTLLAEIQDFHRFRSPRELMSFVGLVPSLARLRRRRTPGGHHQERQRPRPPRAGRGGLA